MGEATTLNNVLNKLNKKKYIKTYAFDISWSRIKYAIKNSSENNNKVFHFMGDLFNIPIADNSIDLVYTSHSIEPNGNREKEALLELYRITRKYLILLEPSYKYATEEGKNRMEKLGYVKNLEKIARELGMDIVEERKFGVIQNPLNPTGLIIIKKKYKTSTNRNNNIMICPVSKKSLKKTNKNCYYCEDSMLLYPIVDNIPIFLRQYAVVATHFKD